MKLRLIHLQKLNDQESRRGLLSTLHRKDMRGDRWYRYPNELTDLLNYPRVDIITGLVDKPKPILKKITILDIERKNKAFCCVHKLWSATINY